MDRAKIIEEFLNIYEKDITYKLYNNEYELKYMNVIIRVNDRYDVKFYPYFYKGNIPTLSINVVRYNDEYCRAYNIFNSFSMSRTDNNEYHLLWYDKVREIYSTLNIPDNIIHDDNLFNEIKSDLRIPKIDNLL